jgi:glycosyltransferase involved in cell wall biosynthesis
MRIAYLSTQRDFYGGEVHLCRLARGMRERGHDVFCVVRPRSRLARRLAAAGLPTLLLRLVDWYEPIAMTQLRRRLRDLRIEVLHTHTPRDHYVSTVVTAGAGIRNVGTRHQLHAISLARLKRPLLRRLDALIAVSGAVRDAVLRSRIVFPERVLTIHNGIDAVPVAPSGDDLRRRAQVAATAPVVGYVGRLAPEKGVETLLAAGRLLRDRGWSQLRIFIVGDDTRGRYGNRLRRRAAELGLADSARFFGYVPDADRVCAAFDVQVVPSYAEPFGIVTLEAMVQGRPVIATDAGGSPEILRDGEEGFLVTPGSPEDLAARLECLLSDPALRRELGRRGRRRVAERFGIETMLRRTEEVYRRVVARRPVAGA